MGSASLAGRTAVVTGGGAGIGGAVTRLFAAEGAHVVVAEIDPDRARAAVADVTAAGGRADAVVGDVRDPATVRALAARAHAVAGGAVDVVVHNVGDYRPHGPFAESGEDDWAALEAVNLGHVLRVTRAFLPAMLDRGSGSIVTVSTVEALRGAPGNAVYSAFKAGVVAFTRSLAVEVAGHGVRVNGIAPDLTVTPQLPAEMLLGGQPAEAVRGWVPLGRLGDPAECAEVALFLAGDRSRYVTGQTIPVDGGTLAASGWYRRHDGRGFSNRPVAP
jgi:NAD(P)-dependent dehydrogenase (short-subunit alcohol dehydrogenase family)